MKKYFLIILFLLPNLHAFCQKNVSPSTFYEDDDQVIRKKMLGIVQNWMAVSVGVSLPNNEFGSVLEKDPAGYAKTGICIDLDAAIYLTRKLGLSATVGAYQNKVLKQYYLNNIYKSVPFLLTDRNFDADKWINAYAALGPIITLEENKIALDLRFLGGMMYTKLPEIKYEGSFPSSPSNIETLNIYRTSDNNFSAVFIFSGALNYSLSKTYKTKMYIKAQYIGASPKLSSTKTIQSQDYEIVSHQNQKQPVGVFNIGIGFKYDLGYFR